MEILKKWSTEELYLLLIVVGYTVFSAFSIPLNIENSRFFSVPYRILILALSLYIIYKNFSFKRFKSISVLATIFFWILYLLKSYLSFTNDFYDSLFNSTVNEIYVRIIIIALIPSIALLFINYKKVDFSLLSKSFFCVLLFMLTLNFFFALLMPVGKSFQYIFTMYYISYGHLAATLTLLSLFFLLFKREVLPIYFVVYGLFLGLITIVIAEARSPFLAIILVVPYLLLVKKNFKLVALYGFLLFLSIVAIYILGKSGTSEMHFVNRTYRWLFEGDNSLRTPLFKEGISIFKANPLFGGRTLFEDGMYPHNIFLELLMATGVLGFITYFLKFLPVFKNYRLFSFDIKNWYHILFFTLFLQYFVLVFTSFALFAVPEFLYFSSIIIGISLNYENEDT